MTRSACKLSAMGVVSALGNSVREHLLGASEGRQNGLAAEKTPITNRSTRVGRIQTALPKLPDELNDFRSRNSSILLLALEQIQTQISNARETFGPQRIGVVLGSSTSGIATGEVALASKFNHGVLPPGYAYRQQEMGSVAEFVRHYFKLLGPAYTVSTACSSSAKVFQSAQALLTQGICEAVILGGVDSLCQMTLEGFSALELLSPELTNPFSAERRGINIGEAACIFLLTKDRGGIQLLGVGEASDGHHMSAPDPEGRGAISAMQQALARANTASASISYLNLHGTGTPANDQMEAKAVAHVFPKSPLCSSTKPVTGHTLGASGALELGFCWAALDSYIRDQSAGLPLPLHKYDGNFDTRLEPLDLVTTPTQLFGLSNPVCMSNSFGFGGSNCSVIIGVGL